MDHFFSHCYSTNVQKISRSWHWNWLIYIQSRVSLNLEFWQFLLHNLKLLPKNKIFRKKVLGSNGWQKHILFICEKNYPLLRKNWLAQKCKKWPKSKIFQSMPCSISWESILSIELKYYVKNRFSASYGPANCTY